MKWSDRLTITTTASRVPGPSNEKSAFSPATPTNTSPPTTAAYSYSRYSPSMSTSPRRDHNRDLEAATSPVLPSRNLFRATVSRFMPTRPAPLPLAHQRTSSGLKALSLQSHSRADSSELQSFTPWQPLGKEKSRGSHSEDAVARQTKRRRIRLAIIASIVLLIILVAVLLVVRLLKPTKNRDAIVVSPPTPSSDLNEQQQKCVDDFIANAAANPGSYSCSTCLAPLRTLQLDFLGPGRETAEKVNAVTQFCGLKAIFDASNQQSQSALSTSGWMKDVRTCAWGGIACDGIGRVSVLELQGAAIPDTIPAEIIALSGLSRLRIVGNGSSPAGPFPTSLPWNLTSLELSQTALEGPLDNALFAEGGRLCGLQVLNLQNNARLGTTLPDTITRVPFQQLTVTGQALSMPLEGIFSSAVFATSLVLLNLSNNNLSGALPSVPLPAKLQTLDLSNNQLTSIPDGLVFPLDTLSTISLGDNPALGGTIPNELCTSGVLTRCDFTQTLFSQVDNPSCGVCQFN